MHPKVHYSTAYYSKRCMYPLCSQQHCSQKTRTQPKCPLDRKVDKEVVHIQRNSTQPLKRVKQRHLQQYRPRSYHTKRSQSER